MQTLDELSALVTVKRGEVEYLAMCNTAGLSMSALVELHQRANKARAELSFAARQLQTAIDTWEPAAREAAPPTSTKETTND